MVTNVEIQEQTASFEKKRTKWLEESPYSGAFLRKIIGTEKHNFPVNSSEYVQKLCFFGSGDFNFNK